LMLNLQRQARNLMMPGKYKEHDTEEADRASEFDYNAGSSYAKTTVGLNDTRYETLYMMAVYHSSAGMQNLEYDERLRHDTNPERKPSDLDWNDEVLRQMLLQKGDEFDWYSTHVKLYDGTQRAREQDPELRDQHDSENKTMGVPPGQIVFSRKDVEDFAEEHDIQKEVGESDDDYIQRTARSKYHYDLNKKWEQSNIYGGDAPPSDDNPFYDQYYHSPTPPTDPRGEFEKNKEVEPPELEMEMPVYGDAVEEVHDLFGPFGPNHL